MTLLTAAHASQKPLVVVLLGPTASGKTCLALQLAEQLAVSVINVDSRQLYVGMDIGTAKPSQEQQKRVRHHLIDIRHPDQPITLQEFQAAAQLSIKQNLREQGMSFLVGGSGLYLKALTAGLRPPAVSPQPALRKQLNALGQQLCHPLLQAADPTAAARIAPNDAVRTQRALEVFYATGIPISNQQGSEPPPWQVLELGLDPSNLRERITQRTLQLYANGLIEETEQLSQRFYPELPLLQTIGYGEALKVIQGLLNRDQAIALTTQRTHQFAKRQRTWFRRQHHPHWLKGEEPLSEALSLIQAGLG